MEVVFLKDLTRGKPWKVLLMFAIPLVLSGLIQQLYNMADSLIVGNFASVENGGISGVNALAAVGASSTITMLFISLGNGGSMGCGVVISQMFGGKRFGEVKTTLYTSLIFFCGLAVVMMIAGSLLAGPMTGWMNTPTEIYDAAVDYLRIYMFGLPFLFIYNVCNAIFNALGDSRKPLYFLIFSSLFNILLDYIFVAKLGWAVKGVAWATFIAQGLACLLSLGVLLHKAAGIDAGDEKVKFFDGKTLLSTLRIGVPSMIQMSIVSLGALLVQAVVNSFGPVFLAGYSSANRIHMFISTVIHTVGSAVSTYTAQNIGAGQYDRVQAGIRAALSFMVAFSLAMVAVMFLFGRNLVGLFVDEPVDKVLSTGAFYLKLISIGMVPFSFFNCFNGVARGAGYMPAFTISTLSDLAVRVAFAYLFAYCFPSVLGENVIAVSVIVGWCVGTILSVAFHCSGRWKHARKI